MIKSFSIALATHNGSRYLPELLDSLTLQRLLPYELVVSDDASTDETLSILDEFSRTAVFPVRLLRNETRLGVAGNFGRAIAACEAEYIALADQDDVWHPDKLEKLEKALATPGVAAVFTDAEVVDAALLPLGYTMWQSVRFTPREQMLLAQGECFRVLLKHRIVTGATMAFKASLRATALPFPPGWQHDAWLALMAAAQHDLVAVPEPLLAYRQHGGNVIGGMRRSVLREMAAALALDRAAWYREEINAWRMLTQRLAETGTRQDARSALADKLEHLEFRARLPAARWQRIPGLMKELLSGRYSRYSRNWGSVAIDLLVR